MTKAEAFRRVQLELDADKSSLALPWDVALLTPGLLATKSQNYEDEGCSETHDVDHLSKKMLTRRK